MELARVPAKMVHAISLRLLVDRSYDDQKVAVSPEVQSGNLDPAGIRKQMCRRFQGFGEIDLAGRRIGNGGANCPSSAPDADHCEMSGKIRPLLCALANGCPEKARTSVCHVWAGGLNDARRARCRIG
jgi:hypothetical protein